MYKQTEIETLQWDIFQEGITTEEKLFELDLSKKQFGFQMGLLKAEYKELASQLYKIYDEI